MRAFQVAATILFLVPPAVAQSQPERVNVAFSDSSRPGLVKVSIIGGGITVKGYDGKEVIVVASSRGRRSASNDAPAGMRRISPGETGLSIEEENNVMSISTSPMRTVDLELQVPSRTNLRLRSINSGNITVERVEGDLDINNTNGGVTLTEVAGSVIAHALNGAVTAVLRRVDSQKPMSFSTLNGKIDVTLPADLRANVKMRSDNGEIYSDFDITLRSGGGEPVVQDNRRSGGRYQVRFDRSLYGTINGGGPEIEFRTFNGSVQIRKATR